jgi:hypothetical protein
MDDSRTPIVTAPEDLILSSVALAAKTVLVPVKATSKVNTSEEIEAGLFIFIWVLLKTKISKTVLKLMSFFSRFFAFNPAPMAKSSV